MAAGEIHKDEYLGYDIELKENKRGFTVKIFEDGIRKRNTLCGGT